MYSNIPPYKYISCLSFWLGEWVRLQNGASRANGSSATSSSFSGQDEAIHVSFENGQMEWTSFKKLVIFLYYGYLWILWYTALTMSSIYLNLILILWMCFYVIFPLHGFNFDFTESWNDIRGSFGIYQRAAYNRECHWKCLYWLWKSFCGRAVSGCTGYSRAGYLYILIFCDSWNPERCPVHVCLSVCVFAGYWAHLLTWEPNLWVERFLGHEKETYLFLFSKFSCLRFLLVFFDFFPLYNTSKFWVSSNFSPRNVIFRSREPCIISNWRFFHFLQLKG